MQNPNSAAARDIASVLHPYTNLAVHEERGPMVIERGAGIRVWDDSGREYIEAMSGLWCAGLGFNEEALVEAAAAQMRKLPFYHPFGHKSHGPMIDLAEKLKAMAPAPFSKVLFANSGSEANDTIIKLIWYYNNAIGRPAKKKIISRQRAYHGVTLFSGGLTALPNNQRDFDMPLGRIVYTDCPHFSRNGLPGESEAGYSLRLAANLERLILREGAETVAAFIAEPVMGAGGVIVPPAGYFEAIAPVLKKYDVFLVADEVICGFGRTGNMWGSQTFGMTPDFLSCAKQLSSGYLPISALMIPDGVYQVMVEQSRKIGTFGHGFTYGGHPVAAAVALRTLELYEERGIVDHVRAVTPHFQARLAHLADHPLVGETRGVGLIGAVELMADKPGRRAFQPGQGVGSYCQAQGQENGLITRALGDSIALCPPMIITVSEVDDLFDRLERALDSTESWVQAEALRQP